MLRSTIFITHSDYLYTILLIISLVGSQCDTTKNHHSVSISLQQVQDDSFAASKAGDSCQVNGIKLCWCPPGTFIMGSPSNEPERRADEDQVEVTLSKGFWMGKYEVTQGQWKRVIGRLPGALTVAGGEGENFPLYNVNYTEAEA